MVKRKYVSSVTGIEHLAPQFSVDTNIIPVTTDLMYMFCVKLGEGAANIYGKTQKAFSNDSLARAQARISVAQRLCKWVRSGGR
jgi:hypothetical protein